MIHGIATDGLNGMPKSMAVVEKIPLVSVKFICFHNLLLNIQTCRNKVSEHPGCLHKFVISRHKQACLLRACNKEIVEHFPYAGFYLNGRKRFQKPDVNINAAWRVKVPYKVLKVPQIYGCLAPDATVCLGKPRCRIES